MNAPVRLSNGNDLDARRPRADISFTTCPPPDTPKGLGRGYFLPAAH
jgi:hypothetical protein